MIRTLIALLITLVALPVAAQEKPQDKASDRTIAAKTTGLQKLDGYVPLYWDASAGKLLMEVTRFNTEMLYQVSLPTGVGSNPLGLDRGQLGNTSIVYFERVGPKVLMVKPNYRFRAITTDEAERRAVEESFARSVLWGFKVESAEAGRVLVDATAFFLRDAHGVIDRLRQARQGQYRFDESRSAIYLPRTKAFPKNTEVEVLLTFASEGDTGPLVRDTVPSPQALTVREHHSFVELPDPGYKPRRLDPRVGVHGIEFYDYASPITDPIEKRWISRHRLQKRDPNAAVSEPVKPIIYYVDNGTPEPIRSALVEGASWWNEAFEAAGFKNAFQVKVLPADADPMDLRYNMINWVHRSTRGWSYGGSVTDPRTGEIIKGNVTLGSLRIRQDYMLGTGMIPPFTNNGQGEDKDRCEFAFAPDVDYLADENSATDAAAMSIARIRQLSAHETGHTLGLAHNFAASTYNRASVMDYPAPMVEIKNGKLDLSNAYARGIGAYDKFAIKYAYSEVPQTANEAAELERILQEGVARGMLFISDADARPAGAAHPLASLWDNGNDPIAMLRHEMEVRRIGLGDFGLGNIRAGTPLSMLEAKLVPLYLHHRYQLQAAVKSLGGVYYTYAVKTAGGPSPANVQAIVPAARQREALAAALDTIKISELAIPARILELIPPTAFGYGGGATELFDRRTDPVFDPIAVATIAADLAISALLEDHRAARLIEFHARNAENPDFKEVVDALIARTWKLPAQANQYHAAVARGVQSLTVTRLMDLAANSEAAPQVRAVASQALRELSAMLAAPAAAAADVAHRRAARDDIERFLTRPDAPRKQTAPLAPPPGDPIGSKAQPQ
ncbi:MAG TPA: zinc-dependent metalloprotease [Blastocatellia bacterium]|nr:zinc-dependent metalloprotease [Blastocatellia bacterium]